jgi:Flp pilus assembly pilin Flp
MILVGFSSDNIGASQFARPALFSEALHRGASEFVATNRGELRGLGAVRRRITAIREMTNMTSLRNFALRLVRDEQGQDLIEYALLATFVSLLAIVGAGLLGTALNNWYNQVANNVNTQAGKVGS